MDYSRLHDLHWGRVDSHPRQADLVPPAGILNQTKSITARAAQIHNRWNSGGHCPREALPVLELWLIEAFHFLPLQPLPQVLGILWRLGEASESFSKKCEHVLKQKGNMELLRIVFLPFPMTCITPSPSNQTGEQHSSTQFGGFERILFNYSV